MNANILPSQKIALISSQYLFRDPRYLLFAQAYKKAGYDVVCINLLTDITHTQQQSQLFKNFKCYTILGKLHDTETPSTLNTNPRPHAYNFINSVKNKCMSLINIKLYTFIIKSILIVKEQFVRPIYISYLHHKVKKSINSKKFCSLIKDIDLVHGCEFFFGNFAAGYTANKFNKKFIFDAKEHHRYMVPEFSRWTVNFIKKYEKLLYSQANIITCVSEPIISSYQKLYPDFKDKFLYIPNCQTLDCYIPLPTVDYTQMKKIKFVVLATYLPFVRGLEYLITIWEKLHPDNAELYIYLSNLNPISKNYLFKLAPTTSGYSLYFMPPVKEDDINHTVAQYDIGIVPYLPQVTLNHLYCCPNKFGQYLAAGMAIMSSDTENIPNQIQKYQLGYIYSTTDLLHAVELFKLAISNHNTLFAQRKNSENYFRTHFNWDHFSANLVSRINTLSS